MISHFYVNGREMNKRKGRGDHLKVSVYRCYACVVNALFFFNKVSRRERIGEVDSYFVNDFE